MPKIEIIDTNASNISDYGFCGIRDSAHQGRRRKMAWLRERFAEGLKFKVLRVEGTDAGMVEYMPGEHTWRPVDASGYLVIHCIMIDKKRFKGRGFGKMLVEECVADARRGAKAGVAVVTSRGTWMAGSNVFRRCGFECVDAAPPAFELFAKRLRPAPPPTFRRGGDKVRRGHATGLTVLQSDQCPCIAKCVEDILRVCQKLRIRPTVVKLTSGSEARNAPSAYGVFGVICDGELVAEHPISGTRFRNIMQKRAR